MKVLLTGGGTAGHVNPALAIAQTIKRNAQQAEIAFVGTPHGMENKLVADAGYPMFHVNVMGIRRSLSPRNIKAAYLALTSPIKAKKIIKEFNPDIIVGTGGYVSWPILVAGAKAGIPTAVHEANAVPGMAVRRLEPYVDAVLLNFEASVNCFKRKDKLIHVGNPLREGFEAPDYVKSRKELGIPADCFYIISYGGSLGASVLNSVILEFMCLFSSLNHNVRHLHACGAREYGLVKEGYTQRGLDKAENIILKDYIYDMPRQMAAADLVICRSGAMTISELALQGKNCILIPSPNVTDNQQYKNARIVKDMGGAVFIEEKDLNAGILVEEVRALRDNPKRRAEMSANIKKFAIPDANKRIYEVLINLLEKKH